MNGFFAFSLFVLLAAVPMWAASAVAIIWSVNILDVGVTLEYNWQTVLAIMVIVEVISSLFSNKEKRAVNKEA